MDRLSLYGGTIRVGIDGSVAPRSIMDTAPSCRESTHDSASSATPHLDEVLQRYALTSPTCRLRTTDYRALASSVSVRDTTEVSTTRILPTAKSRHTKTASGSPDSIQRPTSPGLTVKLKVTACVSFPSWKL